MNKIIFSEGGQPVFLDDLETLQGNSFDMWKAMLGEMTMGAEAFLLRDVTATRGEGNEVTVGSGILVIDGMCCEFSGQTLTASTDDTIYLVVSRVEEDMRVFDDGQERNCSVTYQVTITTDVTGASKYYPLEGLRTFLDLLSDALEANRTRNYPNVEFFNEYSGTVKLARSINKDDCELIVDIKSSSLIWDRQIPGYKGILFKISDEEANAIPFRGKQSAPFTYNGKEYIIACYADVSVFMLQESSGMPENFYSDSYVLPLVPINMTFKLSEFTDIPE